MPDQFIVIDVQGIKEIAAKLAKLPIEAANAGVEAANKYLLDVLRTYPPPKYVTRKAAYGRTFQSDKQRRWFFASLADGSLKVPYHRTQGIRKSWRQEGSGAQSFLANDAPGVGWVMGDNQSRHEALVGWKKVSAIVKERTAKIVEQFEVGVKKAIRKLGL